MSAAFLINPLSHTVAKHSSVLDEAAKQCSAQKYILDPFSRLPEHISDIAKAGIDLIFIEGGDGTIHGVLTEVLRQKDKFASLPKIVILAGGMTNLIALQIGIKKPTPARIRDIIDAPEAATKFILPLINVEYTGGVQSYQGFLFSTGAIATATRYTAEHVHTAGINGSAAVRTTLRRALFGNRAQRELILKPTPLDLSINSDSVNGDHILSVATTLPKPMFGFHVFWGPGEEPMRLTYIKTGALNKIRNVSRLVRKTQSKKSVAALKRDGFQSWRADKAVLTHSGSIILDGEFLPATDKPVTISTTPNFTFLS